MSKELNYMADLERENRTLKSILYCTKQSCNNCGKVNCENFQRQRIDCCGLWVSYKDYITDLENKIADIKANCDLAIEGRDIKIKELELELTVEKDQHQEEINLHLHAEDYINELERLNSNQAESLRITMLEEEKKGKRIEELEKENKKAKQGCHKWFMRWREVKREELEVFSKIEELEKENAELKAEIENDRDLPTVAYMQGAENQKKKDEKQLTKAKEIIKDLLEYNKEHWLYSDIKKQAEQFLKESEK